MLILSTIHSATPTPGGREIVLAIVGGTMLTLALTRPRLRWVERLTEDSKSRRMWAERGLTMLAFGVGGYAWATLFLTLQGQLDPDSASLVRGAAYLLILYAWLTHFEPFVNQWRPRGALLSAAALYTGCAILAAGLGAAGAEVVRTSSLAAGGGIAFVAFVSAVGCFVLCWAIPKCVSFVDRLFDRLTDGMTDPGATPDAILDVPADAPAEDPSDPGD
jgi:hypothetical protein